MDVFALAVKLQAQGQKEVEGALDKVGGRLKVTANVAAAAGAAIGAAVAGTLALVAKNSIAAENTMAQLNATIKSTGGAAGFSSRQISEMAGDLQKVTSYGDDAIMAMQSVLMTFTQVRGDEFRGATSAVLDMATALQLDLKGAALQVGKALNDPVKGVAALARAGVQFSVDQQAMITALVETGRTAEAQRIILKELETQFGGSARAARQTLGGALKALNEAFGDLFEQQGIVDGLRGEVERFIKVLEDPATKKAITDFVYSISWTLARAFRFAADVIHDFLVVFGGFIAVLAALPAPENSPLRRLDGAIKAVTSTLDAGSKAAERFEERLASLASGAAKHGDAAAEAMRNIFGRRAAPAGGAGGGADNPTAIDLGKTYQTPEMGAGHIAFREMMERQQKALQRAADRDQPMALKVPVDVQFVTPELKQSLADQQLLLEEELRRSFGEAVGATLVDSITGGIERAVQAESIAEGFKSLVGALLSGIGSAMIRFGTATAAFSAFMKKIMSALSFLNPAASLTASLAMIGFGAALKGVAAGMFSGGGGGGGGGSLAFAGGGNIGDTFSRVTFPTTNADRAAGVAPLAPVNVTVIGPNDPVAQRQMQELIAKGARR